MRGRAASLSCGVVLVTILAVAGGCYEEEPQPQAAAPNPAQPAAAPAGGRGEASGGNAYGGAKRAAQKTADKVQERQQEIEKAANENP